MTHTTTDAAEARARLDKLDTRDVHTGYDEGGNFVYEDYVRLADVRELLATAEAASGAGEREEWQEKADEIAYACQVVRHSSVSAADRDGILQDAAAHLRFVASLPPATDPAMVEKIARLLCQQHGADPDATAIEPHDCWQGQLWTVFQGDARSIIAALAAAPTIPATGEAVKWRERWYGSDPWKGSAITDEHGNLIAYFGGDEATHAAVTKAVAAHNATIPATGHAATEGEG